MQPCRTNFMSTLQVFESDKGSSTIYFDVVYITASRLSFRLKVISWSLVVISWSLVVQSGNPETTICALSMQISRTASRTQKYWKQVSLQYSDPCRTAEMYISSRRGFWRLFQGSFVNWTGFSFAGGWLVIWSVVVTQSLLSGSRPSAPWSTGSEMSPNLGLFPLDYSKKFVKFRIHIMFLELFFFFHL